MNPAQEGQEFLAAVATWLATNTQSLLNAYMASFAPLGEAAGIGAAGFAMLALLLVLKALEVLR